MSIMESKLADLKKNEDLGYWGNRIVAELEYAVRVSKINDNKFDDVIGATIGFISNTLAEEKVVTKDTALEAEKRMSGLSSKAKEYKMICASHAHIDMNWMWAWDETVAVTIDTFRTMLDLMNEYPDFTFSQSQASVYRIIEEYAPDMLEEIKCRIKEGRWEVTASTWVEADKNMPNGESFARHVLYTKRYLANLLDIDPDSLQLDYEPDTFGHSLQVPEILNKGGVKYYYHCRAFDGDSLYKWIAPSGSSVLVYRDPFGYGGDIRSAMAMAVPEFCEKYHMDTMLKVYGVGDHGGGPTRRDLERIIDMNTWPVFPAIRFGTYAEFFALVEQAADTLPQVKGELNFIFTGCYTSQSRIKTANRIGEATLNEAEAFSAVSTLCSAFEYSEEAFAEAWKNVLFNQFHDIITGSGVIHTREYALGLFQKTMAIANSRRSLALRSIASQIDTSSLVKEKEDIRETISEGAGVGYGIKDFKVMQGERGRGKTRIFHVFNAAPWDRKENVEITVWDWQGDVKRINFMDAQGNKAAFQLLDQGINKYWGHTYMKMLLEADVPAGGYSTYVMAEDDNMIPEGFPFKRRTEGIDEFILENEYVRAIFNKRNASILSFVDKATGEELVDQERAGGLFRYIEEDTDKGMASWIVGRHMNVTNLTNSVKIKNVSYDSTDLRQSIQMEVEFLKSTLKAVISLDKNQSRLDYDVECDWHEIGKRGDKIPQLSFYLPIAYKSTAYKYDVPFGTIQRDDMDRDVPGNSWALGMREESKPSIMMITDTKYGFRGTDNSLSITLIRGSYEPDPYPEFGIHKFRFAISAVKDTANKDLIQYAYEYNHSFNVLSDVAHSGSLPLSKSFISLEEGNVAVSAVKMAEDQADTSKIIVRVYETEGRAAEAVLSFCKEIRNAYFMDLNEKKIDTDTEILIEGTKVTFHAASFSIANLCVEF